MTMALRFDDIGREARDIVAAEMPGRILVKIA